MRNGLVAPKLRTFRDRFPILLDEAYLNFCSHGALSKYASLFPAEKIELPPWRADEFEGEPAPKRNCVLNRILGIDWETRMNSTT